MDAPDLLADAEHAARGGDADRALALLERYREAHPEAAEGYARACEILRKGRRHAEGLALCEAGLRLARPGRRAALLVEKARLHQAAGEHAPALDGWRAARRLNPGLAGAYAGEMACLAAMGEWALADYLAAYARARFPDHAAVLRAAAQVAAAREDWGAALERWERLLTVAPEDAAARQGLAAARAALGMPEDPADDVS